MARYRNNGITPENLRLEGTRYGSLIIPEKDWIQKYPAWLVIEIMESYLFSQERRLFDEDLHAHDGVAVDHRRYLLLFFQRNRPVQDLIGARERNVRRKSSHEKRPR